MPPPRTRRRTPSTKPQRTANERLISLFKSLCAQVDGGHHHNALKTCDKILALAPDDQDALQTKLYILFQLERYSQALTLISGRGDSHPLERTYCLYRLQEEDSAVAQIESSLVPANVDEERGLQHLGAQLKYRQGYYETCYAMYTSLLNTCPQGSEENDDIRSNLSAAQSYVDFINSGYQDAINELNVSLSQLETVSPVLVGSAAAAVDRAAPLTASSRNPRVARIPKHVTVGVTPLPDPERWLKKRDRTKEIRKSRKGRKEGMGAGVTQGISPSGTTQPAVRTSNTGSNKKKKGR